MFANTVVTAMEQILVARGYSQTTGDNVPFAISTALAQPDILDYSLGIGEKVFSKATEPLKTVFSDKNANIQVFLNELQVRSESFG
jgi:hypothetical protein